MATTQKTLLLLAILAACGSNKDAVDASNIDTSMATADSPPLIACTPVSGTNVSMRKIGQVDGGAILATSPVNDGRLFVIQQDGQIRVFENEVLNPEPFLDINQAVTADAPPGERGLLGLAFHPNYAQNGLFYVDYTTSNADVVARYKVSDTDYNKADPTSGQIILSIPDYASNHNGGMIEFGADGYLYVSTGDGGGQGDPRLDGQAISRTDSTCMTNNCEPLLAKILRIDIDHPANGKEYGIPSTNPYAGGGGEPEILIRGLRNPWRWSFDRMTGDLWIGDVGQDAIEELDVIAAAQIEGTPGTPVNLGWSMYEGNDCYNNGNGNGTCSTTGKTMPLFTRDHNNDNWHAIIGGQVYRGTCYPGLDGSYFFTDNTAHGLSQATFNPLGPSVSEVDLVPPAGGWPSGPSSIHADARGELYETTTNGSVYHLEAGP
jgi:glucose/arabinose dehydrogenase